MGPNETSLNNAAAGSGLNIAQESAEVEPLPPLNAFNPAPTGKQMDTEFLNQEWDDNWDDTKKELYYQVHVVGVRPTPESLAQDAGKLLDEQRRRGAELQSEQRKAEAQANTPQAQAELKNKMATTAATQLELQEAYRQEIEYQRSLTTLNDPAKSSAERNAARMQLEALAVSIGKRMNPKLGTSESANKQAKNLAGYIGPIEFKMPYSDFAPRAQTMQRGSEERLGLYRQQMEAAGVPVPEIAVPEAPLSPEEQAQKTRAAALNSLAEKNAMKAPDGSPVMLDGAPLISFMKAGKQVVMRQTPTGNLVELTAAEIAALGGQ